jgi:hypothetical protein
LTVKRPTVRRLLVRGERRATTQNCNNDAAAAAAAAAAAPSSSPTSPSKRLCTMRTIAVTELNGLDIPYASSALLGTPPGVQRRAAGGGDPDQSAGLAAVRNAAKNFAVFVLNDISAGMI